MKDKQQAASVLSPARGLRPDPGGDVRPRDFADEAPAPTFAAGASVLLLEEGRKLALRPGRRPADDRMKQPMGLTDHAHFIGAWFRNPLQTGALWPSGQPLARAMARHVDLHRAGPVVELGAGTGAITRALLARGLVPRRLVAIEKDPALCRFLMLHFPEVSVLRGDVAGLAAVLAEAGVARPGTLVSGLPLAGMTRRRRRRVLEQIVACLEPGGALVQFTYSPLAPIPRATCAALGLSGRRVALVPWNLPPAAVWVYTVNEASLTTEA